MQPTLVQWHVLTMYIKQNVFAVCMFKSATEVLLFLELGINCSAQCCLVAFVNTIVSIYEHYFVIIYFFLQRQILGKSLQRLVLSINQADLSLQDSISK